MCNTIITSMKINFKSLRMSMLNYIMLVVVFPFTYLVIAITSSKGSLSVTTQVGGIILSMIFSLFINMQATLISNSNDITIRETYAVYNVKPIFVFAGQCLFHTILSLPIITIGVGVIFLTTKKISITALGIWLIVSFIFLSAMSILLGIMLKNPHIAGPIINVTYMVTIAITPLYNGSTSISKFYLLNPLAHIANLFNDIFEGKSFCNPILSIAVLGILTVIMGVMIHRILKKRTGNEKQNIF